MSSSYARRRFKRRNREMAIEDHNYREPNTDLRRISTKFVGHVVRPIRQMKCLNVLEMTLVT